MRPPFWGALAVLAIARLSVRVRVTNWRVFVTATWPLRLLCMIPFVATTRTWLRWMVGPTSLRPAALEPERLAAMRADVYNEAHGDCRPGAYALEDMAALFASLRPAAAGFVADKAYAGHFLRDGSRIGARVGAPLERALGWLGLRWGKVFCKEGDSYPFVVHCGVLLTVEMPYWGPSYVETYHVGFGATAGMQYKYLPVIDYLRILGPGALMGEFTVDGVVAGYFTLVRH